MTMLDLRSQGLQGELISKDLNLSATDREQAIATWKGRMVNEHISARIFAALIPQLMKAGLDPDWQERIAIMIQDELRHARLCAGMIHALGGEAVAELPPLPGVPEHPDAPPLEGVLRNILSICCLSETVAVAHAEGIVLQKVAGTIDLDWMALTPAEQNATLGSPSLFAKHTLLLAVGARYRRLRSSMLRAIERGREPAVDFLNGEVIARAEPHGIATPFNTALRDEVKRIASGKLAPSVGVLRALFERTRNVVHVSAPPPSLGDEDATLVPPVSGAQSRTHSEVLAGEVGSEDADEEAVPSSSVHPSEDTSPPPISGDIPIPPGPDSR